MATGTIKTGWNLVWTNPNPGNAFAAQTIALDLSQYSEYRIIFNSSNTSYGQNSHQLSDGYIDGGYWGIAVPVYLNNTTQTESRNVIPTSTGIEFGAGTRNGATNNDVRIPFQIYAR